MKKTIGLIVAASLMALSANADDPFVIGDPFTARAVFSCGDYTMSDGSVDSAGLSSPNATDRGHVASNGNVKLSGGSVINGDATAGPGKNVTTSGSSRVTGTRSSATAAIGCTPVNLSTLAATLQASNDNSRIPLTGQNKNPLTGSNHTDFSMSGGDTIALPAGTYYFTKFTLSGGSVVTLGGPVRILCTGSVSISGGSVNNAAAGAAYTPYRLHFWASGTQFTLSSSTMAGFVYAPSASFTNSSAHLIGGVFANSVTVSGNSHVTRSVDDVAPHVTITSPADGSIVSDAAHVEVRGTVTEDETAVTLKVNGQTVTIAADGTFQTTVNLTGASPATITATATDAAGNATSAHVTVATTPPPVLSLTAPPPGSYVNTRITNLGGGSGNATSVTVNGQPATVAAGAWSLSGFDLGPDGAHTLTIVGTNAGGSTTITPVITSDTVSPSIQATTSPAPNAAGWNRTAVTVHFTCSDAGSGISVCPADVVVTSEGGNQGVTRSADDRAGNSASATATVNIDSAAPTIVVTAPANGAVVVDPHVVVSGAADDAVAITVNGVAASVDAAARTFSSAVDLLEGRNDIAIAGTDLAGNSSAIASIIHLDTRAPELIIVAPAAGACISASQVTVTGRAADSHIDHVTVSGVAATLAADGTWTATLALPNEGRVVITVEATDGAQHVASATVPIIVDRTKPVVSVTSNGTAFGGGAFNRPVALFLRAADADPAAALTVTLDGNPYVSGTSVTAQGAHALRATARDCAGNVSDETTIAFTVDTTPLHVVSFDPAQGATIGAPRAMGGTVDADDLKSATIEGTTFSATISGRTFTFGNVPLAEGTNQFVVEVMDQAGNVARETYSFRLKSTTPTVEILEGGAPIAPGALFNRAITPTIRSNEPGVTPMATLNTMPYALGTLIANDGDYTLTATATDPLGHASAPATATFTIDRTPPTVTISATVSGDHANVTGSVGGGDVTRVGVNNVIATVNGNSYAATVLLEIGANTVIATAVDRAGNATSASIDVARDDNRPGLVLISPENGTITNRPRTIVAGQLLTPGTGAHVTINGVEATVDANGAFRRADFTLIEGDNAIIAAIVGTNRSVTVHVTADFTPPALKVFAGSNEMAPGARYETSPQVTLQSDATATKLSIDGNAITGATPLLADGGHALTATARDLAGNETRLDLTFFVGAAGSAAGCTLSNFDPPNNSAVFSDSVKISGLAGSAANVLVNGSPAQISAGAFVATVALTQEGANTLTIACADATAMLTIYRYTGAPSINIDPITPPATGSTITVTGTVGEGVVSGDVNGIGFTPAAGHYSVPNVSLNKGLNVVTARAKNGAGRIGVATAIVTVRGTAPQIAITSPLPSAETGAASVDVTGTYADADPAQITVTAAGSTYTPITKLLGDSTGTFAVANVALAPNATTTITAKAGQAQTTVDVQQLAGAPSITIESPIDNTFYRSDQQSAALTGSISPIAGSVVQVNGVQAAVDATFHFSASVPLTATATPVIARVSTPDGKSATDSVRIVHFASPLTVVETFPAANATGVDIGAVLVVLFSNSIDASTARAPGALTLADDAGQSITGTAYVDKDAVSFAPNVPLAPGKHYTLTISQTLKDLAGGALAAPYALAFTTAAGAPGVAPVVNESDKSGCLSRETITGRVSAGSAKVRLDVDGVATSTIAAGDGTFKFDFTLSGRPGYHIARVREVGADGSLSPERAVTYVIDCAAPHVLGASLDRAAKKLTIDFSTSMNPSTLIAAPGGTIILGALSGTVTLNASNRQATVAYDADLSTATLTLTVKKEAKDAGGTPMAADFTQTFALDAGPARETGNGYIAGAVYDESTGRPLAGASVSIVPSTEPPAMTAESGRYTRSLPEGAYTIEAGAAGFTTVWRQVVVAAGAGVVPIDIRLTRRGQSKPSGGALALSHAGDAVTRPVDLAIPPAALGSGHTVTLTAVGAQSLAGLLPLGWSPLAAAEIVVDAPIPGSTLTFTLTDLDVAAIAAVNQTLSVVQYDPSRDEWRVVTAVATVDNKRVATVITAPRNYALIYPDKAANLAHPLAPHAGAALTGVANPCIAADACSMTKRIFAFDPPQVAPSQKAIATLITDGTAKAFPSGTAVQAYIDEQLNLSDGRVLFDPPFATDLLVYRNLAGTDGVAMFHVAPTSRAAQETLRDGVDHVRVVDYPGRIDRGTLVGAQGGRVPGDDSMSIDIPSGATLLELHASMTPMGVADLAPFVDHVAGFRVAGGFTFALTRSENAAPQPADLPPLAVALLKAARGTFTVDTNQQVVIAEILSSTPFGAMVRLAATTTAMGQGIFTTNPVDPAQLPVDGILRDGRYLILTADAPVAFAWGLLRNGANGPIIANARITAPPLGVADLTRYTGIFAVPVPAKPAVPFSLRAATRGSGEGTPAVSPSSPDPGQNIRLDIVFDAQPPHLISITPTGEVDTAQPVLIRATFDADIDRATVTGGIVVTNLAGTVDAAGKIVTFTPTQPLQPGATYTVFVNPTIRAVNGAPFGQSASAQFRTRAIPSSTANVDPKKIQITLPDNGISTIRGTAGALPPGANALAVRRERNFVTQYQQTVSGDGSFSFAAGSAEATDRITTTDLIDLQVIDAISHAVIAVIPLTPFITAEGDGFLAPVDRTTSFTTPAGIVITVPAGAFDEPTVIRANPVDKTPFAAVPTFDEELRFNGGVRVDFEGVAKQRIELDIPATTPLDPAKRYYLGRLIDTIRGPRIELDDTLRIDGTKLTTTLPITGAGAASRQVRALAIPGINTAGEVKQAMLGVVQRGDYGTVDLIPQVGWMFTQGLGDGLDIFVNTFKSIAISGFWLSQKSGKALIPVIADLPFTLTGVDAATGLTVFSKAYEDRIAPGDPLSGTELPPPQESPYGPYPAFATIGRIEMVDVNASEFTDDSHAGLSISYAKSSGFLTVAPSASMTLTSDQRVEIHNVSRGIHNPAAVLTGPVRVQAEIGDRVIVIVGGIDVDPESDISIAFSQPITTTDLKEKFTLAVSDQLEPPVYTSITDQATITKDSADRRIHFILPVGLQRGRHYKLTMRETITATSGNFLSLGEVKDTAKGIIRPAHEMSLEFTTRAPGGDIGNFTLVNPTDAAHPGTARDFALHGNVLFTAATNAGLLAYDVSDPAALTKPNARPLAWAPLNTGNSDTWSVATDRHGRVWTTAMTDAFGAVRAYSVDDFINARNGKDLTQCPADPSQCPVPALRGATIVSYRPGFLEMLPLSTYDSGITTTLTTKPEAIPRKMQVITQDHEGSLDMPAGSQIDGTELSKITLSVPFDDRSHYWVQRVTFRNVTLGLEWSKDVIRKQPPVTFTLLGRPTDKWTKSVNLTTYGIVNLFGFGLGVYDLNALESNHWTSPVPDSNPPNGYIPKLEQVLISDAKYQPQCDPPYPPPIPYSCNPTNAADAGQHCAIPDLTFSPESLALESTAPGFVVYGLHPTLGLVDFPINPPHEKETDPTCARKLGLTLAARVQWPASGATRPFDHPRLNTLRKEYLKYSKLWTGVERQPFPRFNSLALYTRRTGEETKEYALIAARDYGLLVVALDPKGTLRREALVDVVWTPAGAYSVRTVPGASVATVVDGAGRVLLIDLTQIDESKLVSPALTCGNPDSCDAELFPTAAKSIGLEPAPPLPHQSWYEVGADDPRILWKSKPDDANHSTLAPVIDPDTGMLYQGDYNESLTRIQSASDPRVRITADLGDPSGPQEISGVTPLGIAPKDPPKCTSCNASPAAFRVEVALPGAMTESLPASGGMLRVALESELVPNGVASQTPEPLPRGHLRDANRSGTHDVRRIDFGLRRLLPDTLPPEFANVRYQRGFNRYISPWIVALADPRAAKQWSWGGASAADKAKKGCYSCDRPPSLASLNEPDVYEIFTTGRFISVRPEVNAFTGTYQYLQKSQRFGARIATVMADTVRDPEVIVAALYPPVARGLLQETTYLHSGEVEVGATDLDAGGRTGWNVILDRTYRSRTIGNTILGFGWESSILKRLRPLPNGDVEFRDGAGEIYLFKKNGKTIQTPYDSPHGVYLALRSSNGGWTLIDQKRRITTFDTFGRVVLEGDEFYQLDGSGNAIAYRYDAGGRLKSIADPVGRVTNIDYFNDDQPSAGMIKEITDWRDRKITYTYEAGLLKEAKLPQVAHEDGGSRPTIRYEYQPVFSLPYNERLEITTNLSSIKDPHEVATGGRARVSFFYAPSGANRDRVTSQLWGTEAGENATFTYASGSVDSTDGLGQVRKYTVTGMGVDARVTQLNETAVATAKDVPFGVLPPSVNAGAPVVENKDRTFTFTFDNADATLLSMNLVGVSGQTYTYENAGSDSAPLPGKIPLEITSGDIKKTFEFAKNGAFLRKIFTSPTDAIATHEPNRDSLTGTTNNDDVNVTSNYDKAGRLLHVDSGGGTDQGRGSSLTTITPKPDDSRQLFERGEVSSIARGTDLTTFLYTSDSTIIFGPRKSESTFVDYDAWRRTKHVSKTGADQSLDESFFYDASGHLVRHERKQGTATVITRFEYDEVGRQTKVTSVGALVKGSNQDLVTTTKYDLPNHKIVTTLPSAATITSDLDTLGRVVHDLTNTGGGPSANIEHHYAYDLAGNRVFATDMKVATAEAFDVNGRNSGTLHSDGTSTRRTFDEWHNLRGVDFRDKNAAVVQSATITPTPSGRIKSVTESVGAGLTRDRSFVWDGGGRTSGALVSGRGAHYLFDSSSHLSAAVAGAATQPTSVSEPFVSRGLQTHDGLLPQSVETTERFGLEPTRTNLQYDTLGNASHVDVGRLVFDQKFDEARNLKTSTPPERGTTSYDYDAASRVTQETLPGGVNKYEHDAAGALSKYTDPDTEQTSVDTDLIGRPLKRHYPDGSEETFEYDGPRLLTYTDRQGRKQVYGYNGRGLLETISLVPGGVIDRIEYDDAGRIRLWTNRDSAVAYSDFNADGLPQTTVVTRYKDHTGLAAPPTIAGEYRQEHRYNEHGERIEWSMPRPAAFTTTSPWTDRVYEHRDAMGNVDQIERILFGSPRSTLLSGQYRNAGRPKERTLIAASGVSIVRDYAYEESTSLGNEMKVSVGGKVVAGSSITEWSGLLIREASLLGISNATRANHYEYDGRGRLLSYDAGRTVTETPSPADFRASVTKTPRFDAATRAQIASKGVDVNRVDPPGTTFVPSPGHKIASATQGTTTTPFAYNASELTSDGKFSYEWDEKGRLTRATEVAGVMRVSYAYDPNDRIIGRIVESRSGSEWRLATPEIITDGLPADASFVFDPVADRVVAIFDGTTGALVRQVIHGGLGYDDPIEVTLTDPTGANKPIQRLYPIYDEAGAGNLQAVLNVNGEVVSRHMSGDAYGDERTSFTGAAIDRVTISSTTTTVTIDVRATELLRADSVASGIRIAAIDNAGKPVRTAPTPPTLSADGFTARTTLTTAEWQTLTAGAAGVSVAATNTLRAAAWGSGVPILPAPDWATASKAVYSTTALPFEVRESLSNLSNAGATTLYEVEDLALLGSAGDGDDPARFLVSSTFQGLPFFDSVTHLTYVRARWLNHSTGQFLSHDPIGYADSSNLYSFCAGDPVNRRDPTGTDSVSMAGIYVGADASGHISKVDYRKYYTGDISKLYERLAADKVPMELRDLIVERVTNTNQGTAVVAELAPQVAARVRAGMKLVVTMEAVGIATVATGGLASAGVTAAGGGTLLATTVGGATGGIAGRATADAIRGKRSSAADYASAGLAGIGGAYAFGVVDLVVNPGPLVVFRAPSATIFSTPVETPFGPAYQSRSPEAIAARADVENGAMLYRLGTMGKSTATHAEAQFWALEHPLTRGFAQGYGVPQQNIDNADFIEMAVLELGANFVTRPAPGVGVNTGGRIEVVVTPNGVRLQGFSSGR